MPTINITREILVKAITAEVRRQSFGTADIQIEEIYGVIPTGEAFEISGLSVKTASPKLPTKGKYTAPAGLGKIRLAAVDGVAK